MSEREQPLPPPSAAQASPPPAGEERSLDDLTVWADRIEAAIAREGVTCVDRVVVVAETASTQDLAREMSPNGPGLVVLAGRQTAGRGRLGRAWADTSHLGLAATFVVEARAAAPGLPIAAGLAACRTAERALPAGAAIGLKWPNDVVERARLRRVGGAAGEGRENASPASGRKIAGVLIERVGELAIVGIGMNVKQRLGDWGDALRPRAVSLGQLGSVWSRLDVAEVLVAELDRVLKLPPAGLSSAWADRDLLSGGRAVFEWNGKRYAGLVKGVSPTSDIEIEVDGGGSVKLPAATASLVRAGG